MPTSPPSIVESDDESKDGSSGEFALEGATGDPGTSDLDVDVIVADPVVADEEIEGSAAVKVLVTTMGDPSDGVKVTTTRGLLAMSVTLLVCVRVLMLAALEEKVVVAGSLTIEDVVLFPTGRLVESDTDGDEVFSV